MEERGRKIVLWTVALLLVTACGGGGEAGGESAGNGGSSGSNGGSDNASGGGGGGALSGTGGALSGTGGVSPSSGPKVCVSTAECAWEQHCTTEDGVCNLDCALPPGSTATCPCMGTCIGGAECPSTLPPAGALCDPSLSSVCELDAWSCECNCNCASCQGGSCPCSGPCFWSCTVSDPSLLPDRTACATDADCVIVENWGCCGCTGVDAVNAEWQAAQPPPAIVACGPLGCPSMPCEPYIAECTAGQCVAVQQRALWATACDGTGQLVEVGTVPLDTVCTEEPICGVDSATGDRFMLSESCFPDGFEACPVDPTWCCDTQSDPLNCGSCGHACRLPPSGTATCTIGQCSPAMAGCFTAAEGIDTCDAYCATIGERCAADGCFGQRTIEGWASASQCGDSITPSLQDLQAGGWQCGDTIPWGSIDVARCCCH